MFKRAVGAIEPSSNRAALRTGFGITLNFSPTGATPASATPIGPQLTGNAPTSPQGPECPGAQGESAASPRFRPSMSQNSGSLLKLPFAPPSPARQPVQSLVAFPKTSVQLIERTTPPQDTASEIPPKATIVFSTCAVPAPRNAMLLPRVVAQFSAKVHCPMWEPAAIAVPPP